MHDGQTPPLIILLSGWASSGKDAAAFLLAEEMQFERMAFADALKHEVSEITGLPIHIFHDRGLKDSSQDSQGSQGSQGSPRSLLLKHALQARETDPDIYSRILSEKIRTEPHGNRIVISDWRYRREYDFLQKMLGDQWTIRRGRIKRSSVSPSTDPSEHDLDNEAMDFIIQNNGCISDLRDSLRGILHH